MASNLSALMGSLAAAVKEQRRQHLVHARNLIEKDLRRLALIVNSTPAVAVPLLADFAALLAELKRWVTQANNAAVSEAVSAAAAVLQKVHYIICIVFYFV